MHSNRPFVYIALIIAAIGHISPAAAQNASLLVRTDLECTWSIDGESKGVLKVDDRVRVSLELGEHLIEVVSTSGGVRWEKVVKLTEPTMQVFTIPLLAAKAAAQARIEAAKVASDAAKAASELASRGYWIDPDTRLMWMAKDNGYYVDWNEAVAYCQSRTLGGYRNWMLPRIEDLRDLRQGNKPKGGIQVDNVLGYWSSSKFEDLSAFWTLSFDDGKARANNSESSTNRVLCVRRTVE